MHIRDNLDIPPTHYRILLLGVNIAESEVFPERALAINPGQSNVHIEGIHTKDPSFGLDAYWLMNEIKIMLKVLDLLFSTPVL